MKTSSAIKVLDGKTRAVYKDEFPGVGLVQKHFIATQSFMPLKRQSSGNCQEERIHGVL